MSYVLIPRLEIWGANAQSAYSIVSGPSPLAFMGFARKLMIDLNGGSVDGSDKVRVAILHHDLEMRGEQFFHFHPAQVRGGSLTSSNNGTSTDYVVGTHSMSLQPVALCNLTVSLIIVGLDGFGESEIENAVMRLRIAGGNIRNCGKISINNKIEDIRMSNGFFVKNRNDLLEKVPAEKRLLTFMRTLHENKKKATGESKLKKDEQNESHIPWLLPMNMGYLPVTPFTKPDNARGQQLHAYTEPLVGFVQYVSRRQLKENNEKIPFWHYAMKGDAFVVEN